MQMYVSGHILRYEVCNTVIFNLYQHIRNQVISRSKNIKNRAILSIKKNYDVMKQFEHLIWLHNLKFKIIPKNLKRSK